MILNEENAWRYGRFRIIDANGLEWTRVVECDTDTGRILRLQTDDQGRIVSNGGFVLKEVVMAAAPLVAIPLGSTRPKRWVEDTYGLPERSL